MTVLTTLLAVTTPWILGSDVKVRALVVLDYSGVVTVLLSAAVCNEGEVRLCVRDDCVIMENQDFLIDNRLSVGRVEVCLDGRFGTICRDSWDNQDASVLCSELGFSRYGAIALSDAQFAEGLKPTSYNAINCHGNESRLSDCVFVGPTGAQSCGRFEDAEVVCQSEQILTYQVSQTVICYMTHLPLPQTLTPPSLGTAPLVT